MRLAKFKVLWLMLIVFLSVDLQVFSATTPTTKTVGGISQQETQREKRTKFEKQVQKGKKILKQAAPIDLEDGADEEKLFIKTIVVEGATLVHEKEINKIISQYEGKELSLRQMRKIADVITDSYRIKGYVTSRAYIPVQTMGENEALLIRVVEGELGTLEVRGNRHFKTSLLENKIPLQAGKAFDYSVLQQALVRINEHPDRMAKAVLSPGTKARSTDVIVEVEDNFPVHVGFMADNYSSKYVGTKKGAVFVEHNNLLGFDDKLYLMNQSAESGLYNLLTGRYSIPLGNTAEASFHFSRSKTKLSKEFEDLDSRGFADIYGVFFNKTLINQTDLDLRVNLGFDYKNINNYLLSVRDSRDRLRIVKAGFDIDSSDSWGRSIFTFEVDAGIPHLMNGMSSVDDGSSRFGGGGKFFKEIVNFFRLQPGPFSSSFLLKAQGQYTNSVLVASEEFQVGGPLSVRGYPVAEFSADKGYYTSLEWSFPLYLFPKDIKVPFTENDYIWDALRGVLFYDIASVHSNKIAVGEKKHRTLKGYGYGCRLNLKNNLSLRVEVGFPIGREASDGTNAQTWVEIKKKF